MALATQGELPFSLTDAILKPYSGGVPGAAKQLPLIRRIELSPNISEIEHRGDGKLQYTFVTYDSIGLTLELGQLNLDVIAAATGGTVGAVAGTTPNQTRTLTRKTTDTLADYQIKAAMPSMTADGGQAQVTFFKCRWAGGLSWPMADNAFPVIEITAKALSDATDQLFAITQLENATTAIS